MKLREIFYGPGVVVNVSKNRPYNPWATFSFTELPGEIRNKIYDLTFPQTRVLVLLSHPHKELERQRNTNYLFDEPPKPRSRLFCMIDGEPIPISLLLVCRFITREALEYMYANVTVCFDSLKAIRKFLDTASKPGLRSINSIELCHNTYGEPKLVDDRGWKCKQDRKWDQVCARLGVELPSLRRLKLDLRICDWPTDLSSNADWVEPLMKLRGNGLDQVKLNLRATGFHPNRVYAAAKKIEDLMTTDEGKKKQELAQALRQIRQMEAKQAQKALLPPVQALKTLVISVVNYSFISLVNSFKGS